MLVSGIQWRKGFFEAFMVSITNVRKWNIQEISLVSVFVLCTTVSMLFCVMYKSEWLLQSEILSQSALSLVEIKGYGKGSLFLYVLQERIWLVPILFLISTTYLAAPMVYAIIGWYGLAVGSLVSISMLRYGLKGLLFILLCGFPQYLFYVPAWVIALRLTSVRRVADKKFFVQFLVLESVIFAGCFVESFINSGILEKVIKIFIGV